MRDDPTREFDSLEARLAAVERAVTDGESHVDAGADVARPDGPRAGDADAGPDAETLRDRSGAVSDLEDRVTDLEADLRAVRGLLDGVQTVEEAVERRANLALAKAESVEEAVAEETDLVVERVPVSDPSGGLGGGTPVGREDDGGTGRADDGDDVSLAARLREAL
jgi:hypothetical protein